MIFEIIPPVCEYWFGLKGAKTWDFTHTVFLKLTLNKK